MNDAYTYGLLIFTVVWLLGTGFCLIEIADRQTMNRKQAARASLAAIFLGPIAVLAWPVALVLAAFYGIFLVIRIAIKG